MRWALVEGFCGSCALTGYLLGAPDKLVPYQGGKWDLAPDLDALTRQLGFWGQPDEVLLADVNPWGEAVAMVLSNRAELLARLEPYVRFGEHSGGLGAQVIFRGLDRQKVPEDRVELCAQLLYLQRMSFGGRAIGLEDGRWSTAGFNKTAGFGRAESDTFGGVRPQGQNLLRTLGQWPQFSQVSFVCGESPSPRRFPGRRVLVYLDPPYEGTTGYPGAESSRAVVVALALAWASTGASVIVSEGEAIGELVEAGWRMRQLRAGLPRKADCKNEGEEWVTYWGAPMQERLA